MEEEEERKYMFFFPKATNKRRALRLSLFPE